MTPAFDPTRVLAGLWAGFALSWLAAALWSNSTVKRLQFGADHAYRIVLILGGIALFRSGRGHDEHFRLWQLGLDGTWICACLAAVGFVFAWWARLHLGVLWSAAVTRKADHRIVDSGPYAIVRHPIYTGILLAVLATMAVKGTLLAVAGALIVTLGFWMKARVEERWLRAELGAAAYDAYARRVPMLLPFGPTANGAP